MSFREDTTLRWSCREGDYVLWLQWRDAFGWSQHREEAEDPARLIDVIDFWELRDGDYVTITNRLPDLPAWFEVHPTDVQGARAAGWMMERLRSGYEPGDPADGPHIWRAKAGERIVWIGPTRPGAEAVNGVLSALDLRANALVVGEPARPATTIAEHLVWGSPHGDKISEDVRRLWRAALEAVVSHGRPRAVATQWGIG
jgi:hypothetical protein